jgi:hypothetical protein
MMAAGGSSKTSAHTSVYRTAWSHFPEDGNINLWAYINKWATASTVWSVYMMWMEHHLQTPANILKY